MPRRDPTDRILFVTRIRQHGTESDLQAAIENGFPEDAFEAAGIVGFSAHLGGGYCVFEYGFEGPFSPIFERLRESAPVQDYLKRLEALVDPAPRVEPGHTAQQPVAADVFLWRQDTGIRTRRPQD